MTDKLELFRLFERKSAAGNTYFTGRMGAASIVVMRDERCCDPRFGSIAEWVIYASEPRPSAGAPSEEAVSTSKVLPLFPENQVSRRPKKPRKPKAPRKPSASAKVHARPFDDPLPDGWTP